MNKPQFIKYGSPDFIAVIRTMISKDVMREGWIVLMQGGVTADHTKAAQYIAFEARLGLLKIDLAKVIGKYIGETEKNLNRIFEQSESNRAILYFDEADALFGARNEPYDENKIFQIFRNAVDRTRRILILGQLDNAEIRTSILEKIDIVVEFRKLK